MEVPGVWEHSLVAQAKEEIPVSACAHGVRAPGHPTEDKPLREDQKEQLEVTNKTA